MFTYEMVLWEVATIVLVAYLCLKLFMNLYIPQYRMKKNIWRWVYIGNCRDLSSGFLSSTVHHCKPRRSVMLQLPYPESTWSHLFFEINQDVVLCKAHYYFVSSGCCGGQKQNYLYKQLKNSWKKGPPKTLKYNDMDMVCSSGTH